MSKRINIKFEANKFLFESSPDGKVKEGKPWRGRNLKLDGKKLNRASVIKFINKENEHTKSAKKLNKGSILTRHFWGGSKDSTIKNELINVLQKNKNFSETNSNESKSSNTLETKKSIIPDDIQEQFQIFIKDLEEDEVFKEMFKNSKIDLSLSTIGSLVDFCIFSYKKGNIEITYPIGEKVKSLTWVYKGNGEFALLIPIKKKQNGVYNYPVYGCFIQKKDGQWQLFLDQITLDSQDRDDMKLQQKLLSGKKADGYQLFQEILF